MSAVTIQCPLCSGTIQIDSRLSGQQVACPLCQGVMTLPALESAPPYPPPPPSFSPAPPPPPTPFEQTLLQLACPMCNGAFQAPLSAAGQQVECPHCRIAVTIPTQSVPQPPSAAPRNADATAAARAALSGSVLAPPPAKATAATVVLPTADGRFVEVPEPAKTVGTGASAVEVRRLTPEERARRRFQRNLILLGFCLTSLFAALYWIMHAGPWK